jgi:hypothetical protein
LEEEKEKTKTNKTLEDLLKSFAGFEYLELENIISETILNTVSQLDLFR